MSRLRAALVAAALAATTVAAVVGTDDGPVAAQESADEPAGFVVRGVGNGHGRGLSQWGSFGRATDAGQDWQEILDTYYGGTTLGTADRSEMRVRLLAGDDRSTAGVISAPGTARWNGSSGRHSSIYAVETGDNTFDVFGADTAACPAADALTIPRVRLARGSSNTEAVQQLQEFLLAFGYDAGPTDGIFGPMTDAALREFERDSGIEPVDGVWDTPEQDAADELVAESSTADWKELATGVEGPIRFTTDVSQTNGQPGDVLGYCGPTGSVTHYRGRIELISTDEGNRVVNQVNVENYLRGVIPRESPASWGDEPGGMNALRAQAVAARSYGLSQDRYGYAGSCDSSSCQVYGGSATRGRAAADATSLEHDNTDTAIDDTKGRVRRWPDGTLVSTEFSASNGPRTAGGAFPPVDDPWDDVEGNPLHRWSKYYSAAEIAAAFGTESAAGFSTRPDADSDYDGIWANEVVLPSGETMSAWDFRNDFDFPAPGFEVVPVTCLNPDIDSFAFIGDSVGASVANTADGELRSMVAGSFESVLFDAEVNRQTSGGRIRDGVSVAEGVPEGTELVVVELGYNDDPGDPAAFADEIDEMMNALDERNVDEVLWVGMSERRDEYAALNQALRDAAGRWSQLSFLDWHAASGGDAGDRWFDDDVHLNESGRAEFSMWLHDRVAEATDSDAGDCRTENVVRMSERGVDPLAGGDAGEVLEVPVLGARGVPADIAEVAGVALNVTAVDPDGPGYLRVWECGTDEPGTSSVNYAEAGAVEPNAVVVPLSDSGKVCVRSLATTDVVVDLAGWFSDDVRAAAGRVADTRGSTRVAGSESGDADVLRVPVVGDFGVPADAAGVALNVTAVDPDGPGYLRVWDCARAEPKTSAVNFTSAGAIEPNAVMVPISGSGEVCIRSLSDSDALVDLAGWFAGAVRPAGGRLLDTRSTQRVAESEVLQVPIRGEAGVEAAPDEVAGVALNVTAVDPDGAGFLRVWECGAEEPSTSAVNFMSPESVEPNAVLVPLSADGAGEVCISSSVGTDVLVDVTGWFDASLRSGAGRLVDTRVDANLTVR